MPRHLFNMGESKVALFQKLIDYMTTNVEGLLEIYREVRLEDAFVNSFCEIVQRVYIDGAKNLGKSLRAYVTRNDFMINIEGVSCEQQPLDENGPRSLKQVEINLSAVVGPHTMQELSDLHRQLVIPEYRSRLPSNMPRDGLVDYLKTVDDVYRVRVGDGQRQCILWLIGSAEGNLPEILACVDELKHKIAQSTTEQQPCYKTAAANNTSATCDHQSDRNTCVVVPNISSIGHRRNTTVDTNTTYSPREIAAELGNDANTSTKVFIVTWDDLVSKMSELKFANQRMYFNPAEFIYNSESYPFEVSVVYFRTGYAPQHYQSQNHWLLREKMEECECAVIPSAVSQLVGLKKAQQVWSNPKFVETFSQITQLSQFFVPQADLNDDDPATLKLIEDAKANPDNYILKPQREGGGNNLYGRDILPALNDAAANRGKNNQILMAKINSPKMLAEIFANDKLSLQSSVSEIGFYGVACFNGQQQVVNESIGYLLRTKDANNDEGGICVDAAVFDSVMLV